MRFKTTLALVLLSISIKAQVVLDVHLKDLKKNPVSSAIIKNEALVTYSNEKGFFRITNYKAGSAISIHKFGFTDTTLFVNRAATTKDTIELFVVLSPKITSLEEIIISSGRAEEINPANSAFVLGYELMGEYMIQLLSRDHVVVIDPENKIKSRSRPVAGSNDIVKHPNGTIHLVTDERAFKINHVSSGIEADTALVDRKKLMWDMTYCDEETDNSIFIRRYKDVNQTVAFFAMTKQDPPRVKLLKEISDAERASAVQAFANETNGLLFYLASFEETNPAGVMGEIDIHMLHAYREAEERTAMLANNYAPPAYSVIKLVNDTLYLFAHDIDSMFVYDRSWKQLKSKRLTYHHLKIWDKELIVNEEKTKVYAKLIQDSKPMLGEIDLQTGTLKLPLFTLGAKFPTRIRIRNNVVYYMAKQKDGTGNTVYSQNLEVTR